MTTAEAIRVQAVYAQLAEMRALLDRIEQRAAESTSALLVKLIEIQGEIEQLAPGESEFSSPPDATKEEHPINWFVKLIRAVEPSPADRLHRKNEAERAIRQLYKLGFGLELGLMFKIELGMDH